MAYGGVPSDALYYDGNPGAMQEMNVPLIPARNLDVTPDSDDSELNITVIPARNLDVIPEMNVPLIPERNLDDSSDSYDSKSNITLSPKRNLDVKKVPKSNITFVAVPHKRKEKVYEFSGVPIIQSFPAINALPVPDNRLSVSVQIAIQEFLSAIQNFEEEIELEEIENRKVIGRSKWYASMVKEAKSEKDVLPEFQLDEDLVDEKNLSDLEESTAMDQSIMHVVPSTVSQEDESFYASANELLSDSSAFDYSFASVPETNVVDDMQAFEDLLTSFDEDLKYEETKHMQVMINNEGLEAHRELL